jgi:RNA polymerase sigma factor (sigma-70 family)
MKPGKCETTFADLMQRVRSGSEDAAWEIIDRFGSQIQRVIHRRLNVRLRSQFDSTDFTQLVWLSFFRHPEAVHKFTTPHELAAYLMIMARNKVTDETRRQLFTKKYDARRVESYDDHALEKQPRALSRKTPSAIAVARERWGQLLRGQPPHYQEVARLRFIGETPRDIAEKLKINERTVRKIINRLFERSLLQA